MEPEQQATQQIVIGMVQEAQAKQLLDSGLFVKSIGVEYKRKFFLDKGAADFRVVLWADRDGTHDLEADLETLWAAAKASVKEQALPVLRARDAKHVQPAPEPQPSPTPDSTSGPPLPPPGSGASQPPTGAPSGSDSPPAGDVKSGTAELVKIACQADGKVEFYCQGFRWPFKDARGAETVITLFDESLGWKAEHLAPGKLYELTGKGFKVDWQKPGKYYDVVRVHK